MKQKMIYITDENFEALKEINASALINEMLNDYFKMKKEKTKDPEVLKKEIEILKIQIEAENKIKEIDPDVSI